MKKTLITMFLVFLSAIFIYSYADAKVSGVCSSCHTMHNSQDGAPMTFDSSATPNGKLLRGSCVGCHAQNTSSNIVDSIPQVYHSDPTDLAAGNFSYVVTADSSGHNVEGILTSADGVLGNTPPGYNSGYDPSLTGFSTASRLVCAGSNGCHGNRDSSDEWDAVSGGHHGDDSILKYGAGFTLTGQGADVPTSYRFLYKIKGAEDSDWQDTVTATDHNEYLAETYATRGTTDSWANMKGTISELCSECHSTFHLGGTSGIGSASPWLRHPTDVVIPSSGEFASISTTYSDQTPVGRPAASLTSGLTAAIGTVAAGTDRVICLSCHRAHGSQYPDSLRYSYQTTLSSGTGCLRCHTQKDPY
ncbi:hypothetical protein BMS3Bbin07_00351 [bacterium BMS3Bbin07]|nr:hypothetical protein BMS3Bbin07_00351 [bacterium BMS3Bbin07]